MELDMTDVGSDITRIALHGRLDTPGVARIETPFAAAAKADGRHAVVDLSDVSFVASMGIRLFISTARTKQRCNMRLVLFGAQPAVREVFEHAALGALIPVVADEAAAMKVAAG